MTDIVERLRNAVPFTADPLHSDLQEAADEIERLRIEQLDAGLVNDRLHAELIRAGELIDADLLARAVKAEAEIERLRHRCRELDFSLTDMLAEIERLHEELIANDAADRLISVSEVRDAALEKAAQAVEAQHIRFADRVTIAAAVRALKDNNHDRR